MVHQKSHRESQMPSWPQTLRVGALGAASEARVVVGCCNLYVTKELGASGLAARFGFNGLAQTSVPRGSAAALRRLVGRSRVHGSGWPFPEDHISCDEPTVQSVRHARIGPVRAGWIHGEEVRGPEGGRANGGAAGQGCGGGDRKHAGTSPASDGRRQQLAGAECVAEGMRQKDGGVLRLRGGARAARRQRQAS